MKVSNIKAEIHDNYRNKITIFYRILLAFRYNDTESHVKSVYCFANSYLQTHSLSQVTEAQLKHVSQ